MSSQTTHWSFWADSDCSLGYGYVVRKLTKDGVRLASWKRNKKAKSFSFSFLISFVRGSIPLCRSSAWLLSVCSRTSGFGIVWFVIFACYCHFFEKSGKGLLALWQDDGQFPSIFAKWVTPARKAVWAIPRGRGRERGCTMQLGHWNHRICRWIFHLPISWQTRWRPSKISPRQQRWDKPWLVSAFSRFPSIFADPCFSFWPSIDPLEGECHFFATLCQETVKEILLR